MAMLRGAMLFVVAALLALTAPAFDFPSIDSDDFDDIWDDIGLLQTGIQLLPNMPVDVATIQEDAVTREDRTVSKKLSADGDESEDA
mmetsp:Transcript_87211/g.244722  ORF Transcript_87211/g.244722 Transcript_87211/m.244722 type:complete len:87 (+) Transcript_87211:101-361(+)|eukprot:CAMPEP_0117496774 /NCGR_PEP_ID=MMETSP0784-20121206/20833_1 /TAXON_ID=39447 /ORGANISM="" /LENGTH=86 /DNA_ID=CAMNT_0005291761 /DNA_START=76 /DNA_END=336 /DNA_ORIENTATION=+